MTETSLSFSQVRNWLVTLPIVLLLLAAILFGSSSFIHAQLLHVGAFLWKDYSYLRADMSKPACNPNPNIDREVQKAAEAKKAKQQSGGGLLGSVASGEVNTKALRKSFLAQREDCRQQFKIYQYNRKMTSTLSLQAFRTVERGMGQVSTVGTLFQTYILVLLVLFGGIIAKATDEHISLRVPKKSLDFRVSALSQFLVGLAMAAGSNLWMQADRGAGAVSPVALHYCWIVGFSVLALVSAWQFWKVPDRAEPGGNIFHALLTIPLYAWLGLFSLIYFFFIAGHPDEIAIQLSKMMKFSDLYVAVGLLIWVGMLLKYTRLPVLVFDVFRPWELAAEIIVIVVILVSAYPTAFTGASGIFVIAIGPVIYNELRIASTRRPLAIAATAMSGSMGVVLAPCMMIVIIAALNKQVTTTQLFGWGLPVFGLSAFLFIVYVVFTRQSRPHIASPKRAFPLMSRALVPLLPFAVLGALVIFLYGRVFGRGFDEFSAPVILPVMLLVFLAYDRWKIRHNAKRETSPAVGAARVLPSGFWKSAWTATAGTAPMIGALLLLMALSVVFGGVIHRSGIMETFPHQLGNIWLALLITDVVLILVGTFIDPYGAIILVSVSIAPIAYSNGIDPVHFWMIVLVAFEVGYLTPPVHLNQLLTRLAIGEKEFELCRDAELEQKGFWYRHERILLPFCIMTTSLLLVTFVPAIYLYLL